MADTLLHPPITKIERLNHDILKRNDIRIVSPIALFNRVHNTINMHAFSKGLNKRNWVDSYERTISLSLGKREEQPLSLWRGIKGEGICFDSRFL